MTDTSVRDTILGGAAYPAAEFPTLGSQVDGTIVSMKSRQVREYDKENPGAGRLKTFPGTDDPIMGVVIDLDTGRRSGDDSGIRRVYFDNRAQMNALRLALIQADCLTLGPELGGWLRVQWTGEDNSTTIPGKLYTDAYRPPGAAGVAAAISNGVAPQQAAQAAPQQYAQPAGPDHAPPGFPAQPPLQPYVHQAPDPQAAAMAALAPLNPQPVAAPPAPSGRPQITATQAAAMANARVDISMFEIIAG